MYCQCVSSAYFMILETLYYVIECTGLDSQQCLFVGALEENSSGLVVLLIKSLSRYCRSIGKCILVVLSIVVVIIGC